MDSDMDRTIRYATIGTSPITEKFISGCRLVENMELAAVYSRDWERGQNLAERQGCKKVYTDLLKMAEDDGIDAVYIASPNHCHGWQSRLFLEHGKHVICEKPITSGAEEYQSLKALADEKGLIYMEAIMARHAAGRAAVLEALRQIGHIGMARLDFCLRTESLGPGALMDVGVYCVYAALDLLGIPKTISALRTVTEDGTDSGGSAILGYDTFSAVLTYCKTASSTVSSEIVGDAGSVKIISLAQYAGVTLVQNKEAHEVVGIPDRAVLMSGEARKFVDYICHPEEFAEDYRSCCELSLAVQRCLDTIKKEGMHRGHPR